MAMLSTWTKHLKDEEEKLQFEQYVKGSRPLIDRLRDISDEEAERINSVEIGIGAFDSPSWPYIQAYWNGYKACLRMFSKLFNLDQRIILPNG